MKREVVTLKRSHHDETIEFVKDKDGTYSISVQDYGGGEAFLSGLDKDDLKRIKQAIIKLMADEERR